MSIQGGKVVCIWYAMYMRYLLLITFLLLTPALLSAGPVRDQHVSAELVPEVAALQPGQPFFVALKLVHDEHWHTYWINEGDSGLPTKIAWDLPQGFSAGEVMWPYPQRIELPPLVSYGYEGETWLLVKLTPPDQIKETEVTLKAKVSWLMCEEVCIPGRASLSVTLPVAAEAVPDPSVAAAFAVARQKIPATETDWSFLALIEGESLVVRAEPPPDAPALASLEFFPVEQGVIANDGKRSWVQDASGYVLQLPLDDAGEPWPDRLRAVMVSRPGMARDGERLALEVELALDAGGTLAPVAEAGSDASEGDRGLLGISIFAFFGGIILNLMPCVFPVISLKILGFVKQAREHPRIVWRHGLVFASGVLVSFWILAGVLLALRAGGASVGWGFQLQSAPVVAGLSLLFFILALNLFGVFEMGLSLTAVGNSAAGEEGWASSFLSGFLATVIATPCTAPFMGVALGYALTQPPMVSLVVFTALGLGMAFPYLLLSRFPGLLKRLPRPGPWMETMKQVMGFLLLATVVWLCWVLSALAAASTLSWLLVAFLLAALGAWILGKWGAISRAVPVRWVARITGLGLMTLSVMTALANISAVEASGPGGAEGEWQAFSPELLAELQAAGQPVFIDFTAKWCLTCQVNKLAVLRTRGIMEAFRERGVQLLYADWTDENEVIARELARYGRQSVPLYVLYTGRPEEEPMILPEVLSGKIVREALKMVD